MIRRRGAGLLAACAVVLALLSGCGSDPAPAEALPQLDRMLTAVDEAMAERRYGAARNRIDALVAEVREARESGDLDPQQADRVLAAAAVLRNALPAPPKPSPTPSPKPAPEPTEDPPASGGSGGSGGTGGSGGSGGSDRSGKPGDSGKPDNAGKSGNGKGNKGGGGKGKRKGKGRG
ncbi:hypothetical protein [Nocardioides sp. SYSU DS0651]|uniref:hypothetical protein n=1 Tax=Nocardioides sp. SYSU DS0651 TaxID=3415955 RepID=UPI003F4BC68D